MERFQVKVEGLTPLLMHHNNLMARDALAAKGRKGGKAGDDRHPVETWKTYLYEDGKQIVIPQENFLAALLKAGSSVSIGKMRTLKAASQAIYFDDTYVPLVVGSAPIKISAIESIDGTFAEHCTQAKALGFELFVKPCSVNGKSHVRVRPKFEVWSAELTFETDDADLLAGENRIADLWEGAGRAGIGDWRPSSPKKPGPYGRFKAVVSRI
jgi:hypothetical protein